MDDAKTDDVARGDVAQAPKFYVMVCSKCGCQVQPHVDHNLGTSRVVHCDHGNLGLGTVESVTWERIEVAQVAVDDWRAVTG